MPRKRNLVGIRFERLRVVRQAEYYTAPSGRLFVMWVCICDCGNTGILRSSALTSKSSSSRSCGCLSAEMTSIRATTHGKSQSREYTSYQAMKKRVQNPNDPAYKDYGDRGITVCDRWLEPEGRGFINFLEDMGERPQKTSLERLDNEAGYSPANCVWATKSAQQYNRRNIGESKYRGVFWCKHYQAFCLNVRPKGRRYFDIEEEAAEWYDNYVILNNLPHKPNPIEIYPEGWFDD